MSSPVSLARIDLRGRRPSTAQLRALLPRGGVDVDSVLPKVRPIVEAVRGEGAAAALRYGEQFDGVRPNAVRVAPAAVAAALDGLDPRVEAALQVTIERARLVHTRQRPTESTTQVTAGGTVTERWVPAERVGLYVPGGQAVYPSSVVMNVVPAQVAGVSSVVVATPPQREFGGLPHPTVLAAAGLLGVTEVWAVGGAQAVALLAHGGADTNGEQLLPVDMITGPGNVFVTAAKRLCRGSVGIDAEAGPTEIAVLADDSADPRHVAADLISQAEHDVLAAGVLVTESETLADTVDEAITAQLAVVKHVGRVREALGGSQSATVLVDDIDQGLRVVDAYAAEHLEIQTREAESVAGRVRNAGAVFIGPHSPVSLGDYCAGSNHVLPTAGCARHSSGLNVHTFLRNIQVVHYDETALREVADAVVALAAAEDLPAHGQAVRARFGNLIEQDVS